jgi:hypothetical protein
MNIFDETYNKFFCVNGGNIAIVNNKVTQNEKNLFNIDVDIDTLNTIPEGSYLRFFDDKIISGQRSNDKCNILYSLPVSARKNISICCNTGNIYGTATSRIIPELCNYLFSRSSRYSRIKKS